MEEHDKELVSDLTKMGIKFEDVHDAIIKSGYPLQNKVASIVKKYISHIDEESGFIDKKTGEIRSIDLSAFKPLWNFSKEQPRVRPNLSLLIECKQSELPYIFFLSDTPKWIPNFPIFAGLFSNDIETTTDDDASTWSHSINQLLELHKYEFISKNPIFCTTMSKCERKGKKIELSGALSFSSLIFPLINSMEFFADQEKPPRTAVYFDCHMIIGVGVLDAPMISVDTTENKHVLKKIQWVRITKHNPDKGEYYHNKSNIYGIDIVHKDFLDEYIKNHLLPFTDTFSRLVLKHADVLASSKGFISGMGKNSHNNIESRLEPRRFGKKIKRGKQIGKNIMSIFKS